MRLTVLFIVQSLSSAIAYSGDMTHYETGKPINHIYPPLIHCEGPAATHSHPRSRLLRLHLPGLRRHRGPLRPDDEQSRQSQ